MRIAFAGNPNSGKTTMFNALTGRNERVGNWAGVTVDKKEAPIKKGYTGAFSVEHHSGQLEVERTHWQLASLREIMAEIALEGTDTKEKAYMSQLYAGERRT